MLKTVVLKHEYDLYILKKKTLKSEDSLKILIPVITSPFNYTCLPVYINKTWNLNIILSSTEKENALTQ